MSKLKDLTGQRFGKLVVLERVENGKHGHAQWRCRCDCGNEVVVRDGNLKRGRTQSCGCLQKERVSEVCTTHGMRHSKVYRTWDNIKKRCYNPNYKRYKDYGGRGITMYEPWVHNFQAFYDYVSTLEHFGEEGYTLDREDNDGNYEPGNLRFADAKMQRHNRRDALVMVEYNGEQMCLKDAAERSGINYYTLYDRYQRGGRGDRLFRPVRGSK